MTLSIELPVDLENKLTSDASRLGMSLPDYALQVLSGTVRPLPPMKCGVEVVAYWRSEGLLGTRPDITDSVEFARQNRIRAEHRIRE